MCPAESKTRLVKTQKNGIPWIVTVSVFQTSNPPTPIPELDVEIIGLAEMNIQTRYSVLMKPTIVERLMSASKDLSILDRNVIAFQSRLEVDMVVLLPF